MASQFLSSLTLSKLIQTACNIGNFVHLVNVPTRFQYNSVNGSTAVSCIDHVYTNFKFRCSSVTVHSFGNSDHDLLEYTRFSKEPPTPSRTIRKRTYKSFNDMDFIAQLKTVDWSPIYWSQDVDLAVRMFTNLFTAVLDEHAPWICYQQWKTFRPWISSETLNVMKSRDEAKSEASLLAKEGKDACTAWNRYKKLRNRVSNRLKSEERAFKHRKIMEVAEDPKKILANC